jgi:hypothetical protein
MAKKSDAVEYIINFFLDPNISQSCSYPVSQIYEQSGAAGKFSKHVLQLSLDVYVDEGIIKRVRRDAYSANFSHQVFVDARQRQGETVEQMKNLAKQTGTLACHVGLFSSRNHIITYRKPSRGTWQARP